MSTNGERKRWEPEEGQAGCNVKEERTDEKGNEEVRER